MSWIPDNPHWLITALIGAILGCLIPYAVEFVKTLRARFNESFLIGDWYEYHISCANGGSSINKDSWNIKRGLFYPLKVECISSEITYVGSMEKEREHLIVTMNAKQARCSVHCRFEYPFPSNPTPILGLWLSFDHDNLVSSGAILLSKDELSDQKIRAIMKSRSKIVEGLPLMKIKSKASVG